jgi:hypothetical protein
LVPNWAFAPANADRKKSASIREFFDMRGIMSMAVFAAALSGLAIASTPHAAFADQYDGNWSVLVVTEKGTCDRAYRYAVRVANGRIRYIGNASVRVAGTVTPTGVVGVSIARGKQSANGTGRLSARIGVGRWHGVGSSGSCSGRWDAERR